MSLLVPQAHAAAAGAPPQGSFLEPLFLLLLFVAFFYFMIWRPSAKQRKEREQLMAGLDKGDEVVTAGGVSGTLTRVEGDFVLIRVADNLELRFSKTAVTATLPKGTLKQLEAEARRGSGKGSGKNNRGKGGRNRGRDETPSDGDEPASASDDDAVDAAGNGERDGQDGDDTSRAG